VPFHTHTHTHLRTHTHTNTHTHTSTHTHTHTRTHTHTHTQDAARAAEALVQEARAIWETREGSDVMIDDISALVVYLP